MVLLLHHESLCFAGESTQEEDTIRLLFELANKGIIHSLNKLANDVVVVKPSSLSTKIK